MNVNTVTRLAHRATGLLANGADCPEIYWQAFSELVSIPTPQTRKVLVILINCSAYLEASSVIFAAAFPDMLMQLRQAVGNEPNWAHIMDERAEFVCAGMSDYHLGHALLHASLEFALKRTAQAQARRAG